MILFIGSVIFTFVGNDNSIAKSIWDFGVINLELKVYVGGNYE